MIKNGVLQFLQHSIFYHHRTLHHKKLDRKNSFTKNKSVRSTLLFLDYYFASASGITSIALSVATVGRYSSKLVTSDKSVMPNSAKTS